jgi:uncharacterized protein YegL
MTDSKLEFVANPEQRLACVLVLDTSSSMSGAPIDQLNKALKEFEADLKSDTLAQKRVEVAIITFDSEVKVYQPFTTAAQFTAPTLTAQGTTCMGAALERALDELDMRKLLYTENGVPFYRPWMFLITDGAPTDSVTAVSDRIKHHERNRGVAFFPLGVHDADMDLLKTIGDRPPLKIDGARFKEFFLWLSASLSLGSKANPNEQIQLAEVRSSKETDGWKAV